MNRYKVAYFGCFFVDVRKISGIYKARNWIDAYSFWVMIKKDFPDCYIQRQ